MKKPIAMTITMGRRQEGNVAVPTDPWHICISGHMETDTSDGDVVKTGLADDHFNTTDVDYDARVMQAFGLLYQVFVDRMEGRLPNKVVEEQVVETPTEEAPQ